MNNKIHGLTVCVEYADYLEQNIDCWLKSLDSLTVVTSFRDERTRECCAKAGARIHATDIFYARGASFNKWAALSEAVDTMPWCDWILLIDADIHLPDNWRAVVDAADPEPGYLYGAKRFHEDGRPIDDADRMPGYFNLFHAEDVHAGRRPLFETHWTHAGRGDCEFHGRWPIERRVWLPMAVTHRGEPNLNWWGRGKPDAMGEMVRARLREGGLWSTARMEVIEGYEL